MSISDEPDKNRPATSGDPGASASASVAGSNSGVRRYERVPVSLGVTLGVGTDDIRTISVDISEMGLLIRQYSGDELAVGDHLKVLIKGIIADDDVDQQLANMVVKRVDGEEVALGFDFGPEDE